MNKDTLIFLDLYNFLFPITDADKNVIDKFFVESNPVLTEKVFNHLNKYIETTEPKFRKKPTTYLKDKLFLQEIKQPVSPSASNIPTSNKRHVQNKDYDYGDQN